MTTPTNTFPVEFRIFKYVEQLNDYVHCFSARLQAPSARNGGELPDEFFTQFHKEHENVGEHLLIHCYSDGYQNQVSNYFFWDSAGIEYRPWFKEIKNLMYPNNLQTAFHENELPFEHVVWLWAGVA